MMKKILLLCFCFYTSLVVYGVRVDPTISPAMYSLSFSNDSICLYPQAVSGNNDTLIIGYTNSNGFDLSVALGKQQLPNVNNRIKYNLGNLYTSYSISQAATEINIISNNCPINIPLQYPYMDMDFCDKDSLCSTNKPFWLHYHLIIEPLVFNLFLIQSNYPSTYVTDQISYSDDEPIVIKTDPGFPEEVYQWQYFSSKDSAWTNFPVSYLGKDSLSFFISNVISRDEYVNYMITNSTLSIRINSKSMDGYSQYYLEPTLLPPPPLTLLEFQEKCRGSNIGTQHIQLATAKTQYENLKLYVSKTSDWTQPAFDSIPITTSRDIYVDNLKNGEVYYFYIKGNVEYQSKTYPIYTTNSYGGILTIDSFVAPFTPNVPKQSYVLCKGQNLNLDITIPQSGATYKWYNDDVLFAQTPMVSISDSGTYRAEIVDTANCQGKTTFTVARTDKEISADFLIAGQVAKGDNVEVINISDPLASNMQWVFPSSSDITVNSNDSLYLNLTFNRCDTFEISLKSSDWGCEAVTTQKVIVVEQTLKSDSISNNSPFIIQFQVAPNPSSGIFDAIVEMSDITNISLSLYDSNMQVIDNRNLTGEKWYKANYNLQLSNGMYFLRLTTPNPQVISIFKIIIK